ncbi:MAG: lipid-A-disaccharide synthase [Phycisphaerales bacterium]
MPSTGDHRAPRSGVPVAPGTRSRSPAPSPPALLFTAFEPSGDDHASPIIAELRRRHPDLPIFAWGGRKMEAAGATIVERTGDDAVMGMPGISKIIEHGRINRRVDEWLDDHRIAVHIPVDSPAANFPICFRTKSRGIKVVHLVAPQMWAWGPWRISKLRRLTDLVLCFLPFEEEWFLTRGVPARFIGHPLFDEPLDYADIDARVRAYGARLPDGSPRIALMPGSRPAELAKTLSPLLDAFRRVRADFPRTAGVLAVTRPDVADELRFRAKSLGGWPEGLDTVAGDIDAVVRWCDLAIVKSGTVTLHVARQTKPMITFYRPDWLAYQLVGRWIVSTPYFTLPNLIAGKRIIPELIPHFGDGADLATGVYRILRQPGFADDQRLAMQRMCEKFAGHHAVPAGVDAIERVAGISSDAPVA